MHHKYFNKLRSKTYRYFFFKLLLFFLLVFLLDYFTGNLLNYFYFKQESGIQYQTTYAIEKTRAEVIIFGSSRANHHYYPDLFEKRLHLSCHNAGRDGQFIFYHLALLNSILGRYSPKIIVLDLLSDEFVKNTDSYERLSVLLPYYNSHPEIRSTIELKSTFERYKLVSRIYPFNSSLLTIAMGNLDLNKHRYITLKGYIPLSGYWNGIIKHKLDTGSVELDSKKIESFETFIKTCKNKGIKLYVCVSPLSPKSAGRNDSAIKGKEIVARFSIPFYDFSNDTAFTSNPSLFADAVHLNNNGAKLFTDKVIDRILIGK